MCFENAGSRHSDLALISSEIKVEINNFIFLAFQLILRNPRITLAFFTPELYWQLPGSLDLFHTQDFRAIFSLFFL